VIRLGLIGAGVWGKNYIAAAKETGIAEVVWTAGRDWHGIWTAPVDAVVVATPPEPRAEICTALVDRNFPVMAEKPLSLSGREVELIKSELDNEIRGRLPFLVDYTHLFSPAYEALRAIIQRSLGRVRVYGRTSSPVERSYSPLWDHGCHDLAMCLGLGLEKPIHVSAAKSEDGTHQDMDVQFDSGDAAHIRVSRGPKGKQLIVMCGSMGAVYDAGSGTLEVNGKLEVESVEKPLTRAVRVFAQAVKDGGTDDWRFGIESSMEITRMLEQVHM
jgi:predicted dehydrogenase